MSREGNRRESRLQKLSRLFSSKKQPSSSPEKAAGSGKIPWENYEMVFKHFDQNGDGKVSPSELSICMRTAGEELSEKDAEAVIGCTDSDGDGLLGYEDFVSLVSVKAEEEELRDAFGMYEMKGEGCITAESLRRTLRQLGDSKTIEDCMDMIRRYDLDGDGVLSFEEFKTMMMM